MPERDVFERRLSIGPHDAREAADLLADDGVLLVRHGRRALLAAREVLARFAHFGALQMPDFERDLLAQSRRGGQRGDEMSVPVALNHLRSHGRGIEAQLGADALFHFGTDVGEGAHRA